MIWISPSKRDDNNAALEKRLWDAHDQPVPASHLTKAEYNVARPDGHLGLLFVCFALQHGKFRGDFDLPVRINHP